MDKYSNLIKILEDANISEGFIIGIIGMGACRGLTKSIDENDDAMIEVLFELIDKCNAYIAEYDESNA